MKHTHLLIAPFGSESNGIVVEKCHNLRPTYCSDGVALRPAARPLKQYTDGWQPLVSVPQPDGTAVILLARDNMVAVFARGEAVALFALNNEPLSAWPSTGRVRISTASSVYNLTVTPTSITGETDHAPEMPRVSATSSNAVITTNIPSFTLQRAYGLNSATTAADRRTLSTAALDAYQALDSEARVKGLWWQPAIIQTVLRDAAGHEISRSAPILMIHPEGKQFNGTVELRSSDSQTTAETSIQAPAWNAILHIPAEAATEWAEAASLEVVASPTLHMADVSRLCTVGLRRRTDAEYFATIAPHKPAAAAWVGATDDYCRILSDVAARSESMSTTILSLPNPANWAGKAVALPPAAVSDVAADNAAIARALKKHIPVTDRALSWLKPPHTIANRLFATSSDLALCGDLSVIPYAGHPVEAFALAVDNKPWQAAATVTFADGSQAVHYSEGNTNAPLTFNPLISYPSPQAVSISFNMKVGDNCYQKAFDLTPDIAGNRAVYIAPHMQPFTLDAASEFVIPPDSRHTVALSDYLIVTPINAPSAVLAAASVPEEHFHALTPALFGQNAWEFGRGRFLLMARGGIYSVCLNAARARLAVSLLDKRVVPSPAAISSINGELVAATTSSSIVTISGNKVRSFANDVDAAGLVFDSARGELWCIPSQGNIITVICTDFDKLRYTVALDAAGERTIHLPVGDWLCSASDAYRFGRYEPIADTEIEWQASVSVDDKPHRMASVHIGTSARAVDLTADISKTLLSTPAPYPLWQRRFQGRIGADIHARFFNSYAHRYVLRLAGAVSHDFVFSSFNIQP